jgi:hypothetical protein
MGAHNHILAIHHMDALVGAVELGVAAYRTAAVAS